MRTELVSVGKRLSAEVAALFRARNPLLFVVSEEEGRVEKSIIEAAFSANYLVRVWDCAIGAIDPLAKKPAPMLATGDPDDVLQKIRGGQGQSKPDRAVWILRDFLPHIQAPVTRRALKNLARELSTARLDEARVVVVLGASGDVPPDLRDLAIVVPWQLPDRIEMAEIFDRAVSWLPEEDKVFAKEVREEAIEAAIGLSAEAASSCYAKSLVTEGKRVVPRVVSAEKRRVVSQAGGIEWFDPDPRGLAAVGGLDVLKRWLVSRRGAFTQRARDFGLPSPRGALLVGVAGCGKSLVCKAIASSWGVPLLRLDPGAAKSKYVGDSEKNIRQVLSIADAVGNCVLWLDEVEKQFSGAVNGALDGGVASDAFGTFLTWMQERKGGAFVLATSNDVSQLPPEFLRKGRFDEIFFVDLPSKIEREEILRVSLRKFGRDPDLVDVTRISLSCQNFTGSEMQSVVESALYMAFEEGERVLQTADLLCAAEEVVPLAKTAAERLEKLRDWAKERARAASCVEAESSVDNDVRVPDVN